MTIHSDWSRLMHGQCPQAFHAQIPEGSFDVGVIDGHLQLMCLHSGFPSWDAFLFAMFVRPIQKLYDAGCPVVVLCFDSYAHVPAYKSMTQQRRSATHSASKKEVCVFEADQELPNEIPSDAMLYLMNRNFKLKVIQLACARLPRIICHTLLSVDYSRRRFLLDYKCVVEYFGENACHCPVPVPDLVPLGESDIKFARYVERYGSALVHAIDGDYMIIALLYYASCGVRPDNRIFLFRQLSKLTPSHGGGAKEEEASEGDADTKKRKSTAATAATAAPKKCWVDMQRLFAMLADEVRGGATNAVPPPSSQISDGEAVHAMVSVMLCAGTDFSRPMPLLGPKRMWDHLPQIARALLRAAPLGHSLRVSDYCDHVIAPLYTEIFSKHVAPVHVKTSPFFARPCDGQRASSPQSEGDEDEPCVLPLILRQLRASKLSRTTISRLPSVLQVQVTIRNINWVIKYWLSYNSQVPAPLDGRNGYVSVARDRADDKAPPSGTVTSSITFYDLVDHSFAARRSEHA